MIKTWTVDDATCTIYQGRVSITALPSMKADDGSVAVGIEAPWLRGLLEEVKDALEGDSNDAEHDALSSVADAFGVRWENDQ